MYGLYGFLFCNPKIVRNVRIVRIFSNCTDCTDFYPGNTPFFNFHSFQQVFHENFKKKSRQNEVSLTYFLHSK